MPLVADDLSSQRAEGGLLVRHILLPRAVAPQVKVALERLDPGLRKVFEALGKGVLPVMFTVEVRTMRLFAIGSVLALLHFKEVWVVLLLFPAVRVHTLVLIGAALRVRTDKVVDLPVLAHFARIHEHAGPAPVVLPVVRVHADLPVVVVLPVGAPDCFEEEHVEVHIDIVFLDQLNR